MGVRSWQRNKMAMVALLLLTLLVHGTALIGGVRVVGRVAHLSVALVDHAAAGGTVLAGHLAVSGLVADRRQLRADTTAVGRRLTGLGWVGRTRSLDLVGLGGLGSSTLALLGSLALGLFLLLAGLPLLADLLEFWTTVSIDVRSSAM